MVSPETYAELKVKIGDLEKQIANLKHTEQSFKNERDFINEVLYWIESLVVVIDLNGYILLFNRASEKLSGYSFDEVRDRPFWDILISNEEREGVKRAITNVIDEALPNNFQNHWITTDGDKRLISWVNSIFTKADGSIEYILCTGRDITEQKLAEDALIQSESKYRMLVQSANSIILRFDTQGRITFFNEYAQEFFGYTEQEILHQNVLGTILPQTESSGRNLTNMMEDMIQNPSKYLHNENENIRRDGKRVWIGWTNKPILDANGKVSEILSIGMDISDRKRAEQKLQESVKRFNLFMDHSPAVTFIKNLEGKYVYFSKGYYDVWGEQAKAWIGKTDEELWSSEIAQQYRRNDDVILASDGPLDFIETWETPDGPTEWRTYKFPVRDTSDNLLYLAGIAVDITEQRKLAAQVKQAQRMEAIGTLAGGIAHDFNNILAAVLGYAELAQMTAEEKTNIDRYLKEILRAGERAKNLVKQILTFSRQTEQKHKPIQIKPIFKETLKFLRASIPTTIEIRPQIKSDALVMADPTQIHQVIMNLCTNAEHAMREKGGVLEVTLLDVTLGVEFASNYPELKPGEYQELTVRDTGHGIPDHIMNRIYDPFFTTKKTGEGTGMGLAVVHGIVGSHGGAILVTSNPGKGSTFKVYLPVVEMPMDSQIEVKKPLPTGAEHILFVDDEPALVNIGKQMLGSLGYDVTGRTGSIEALELFRSHPNRFDLVITDMSMPNMSGDLLAAELIKTRPDIPIILCTGYSAKISEKNARVMGIKTFAHKPIVMRDLAQKVRAVLDDTNR